MRWHKTGKTKPVSIDGKHIGCKKIMVLYMSTSKGGKPEKTNWVMHQYHLGTNEDEKDGEYVVSKLFYQQQAQKTGEKIVQDVVGGDVVDEVGMDLDLDVFDVPKLYHTDQTGQEKTVQEPELASEPVSIVLTSYWNVFCILDFITIMFWTFTIWSNSS